MTGSTRGIGAVAARLAGGAGAGHPEHGIYGTVLTAGLLAAQDPQHDSLARTVIDVLVTVTVFWLAHGYAHAVGHHLAPGRRSPGPGPPQGLLRLAWTALLRNWPLVQASVLPLAVLILARVAGATAEGALQAALWTCVVLLAVWGLLAGGAAGLTGWRLARYATGSSLLGLILVALEVAIH
ncbi:hypothetical protein ND748_22050 [Frankia sp. AiPs1]|uniref:hypothetical protein n=1 Tax=Frankia sp. AiPs1 TaxID=573493 RepID=UPI002044C9CF|nr:hypothetical protein [Frankia sp. AiPs1]MCM3924340.1 hypothetical protein [Frankia sp. AiPs1]